ncbi:PadR family transcriptional regulator [uncultured Friedmanniella sp.]|uniref:PadR family transcriptional regulator n=1 Tax=uncultured Friedmanniella sp. TaxID=335381 RepID=UPI0035CA2892
MTTEELRQPTLLVLTALTSGPRHGYALIEAVAELSGGRVRLKPGSLYGALDRLAREGLVRESATEVVAGRHRRYYELTDVGAHTLSDEVERLEHLTRDAAAGLRRRAADGGRGQFGATGFSTGTERA